MFTNHQKLVPVLINGRSMKLVESSSILSFLTDHVPVASVAVNSSSDERIGSLFHPQALFVVITLILILLGCIFFG